MGSPVTAMFTSAKLVIRANFPAPAKPARRSGVGCAKTLLLGTTLSVASVMSCGKSRPVCSASEQYRMPGASCMSKSRKFRPPYPLSSNGTCALMRASLAAVLGSSSSYDRVLVPLVDADVKSILSHHTKVQLFPTELSLDNICDISSVLFQELCEALALSTTVQTLKVCYEGHEPVKGDLFSSMLKDNKSITSLEISLHSDPASYCLAVKVAAALIHNTTLQELSVCFASLKLDRYTALSFCHMLSKNEALCKVFIKISHELCDKSLELLSTGVQNSEVLLEFGTGKVKIPLNCTTYPMFKTLQQNNSRLNKAVMFVQHKRDRQCAVAFEYLCRKPHFVSYVARVAGQSISEAYQNIKSSQRYLFDNFFVIAGIVRHSLQCYPGQGTQIDALNADSWRAIAQYVKMSDISA